MPRKPTTYSKDTPAEVIAVLERLMEQPMERGNRVRVDYGYLETGQSWGEEHGVEGYVLQSSGPQPAPVILYNTRAIGGPLLLDDRIIKITNTATGRVLYQHPNYTPIYDWEQAWVQYSEERIGNSTHTQHWVFTVEEGLVAGFKTEIAANRWLDKRRKYERRV